MQRQPHAATIAAGLLFLILFLLLTNPNSLPIGFLIIPIVLIFIILFCISQIALAYMSILTSQPRKKRALALIISSLASVVLILQSSGGISGADVILLGLIIVVLGVYVSKF